MILGGLPTEFYVPPNAGVVVLGDYFASDLTGGAELTTEALIQACPRKVFRLHSHSLTSDLVEETNLSKVHWVVTNYTNASLEGLQALVESGASYSVVEYDWKFCRLRAPRTCGKDKQGGVCSCLSTKIGEVFRLIFDNASKVFWMSAEHMREHQLLTNVAYNPAKHFVQGSTWTDADLDFLRDLRNTRRVKFPGRALVLNSSSWIKGRKETVRWCQSQAIPYDLVGNMPHRQFLWVMSTYDTLVFRPADRDTCPRVVVEAKLMGLENLLVNDNVQHTKDPWWSGSSTDIEIHLKAQRDTFWSLVLQGS